MIFSLLLPGIGVAKNNVPPATEPAQSLNQADVQTPKSTSKPAQAPVPLSRGQLLYENHCMKCHESKVHIRNGNKAKSIDDVRGWVTKWQTHEKLEWGANDINDVTGYLVDRFYNNFK